MAKTRKKKYDAGQARSRKKRMEREAVAKEKAFLHKYMKPFLITLAAVIAAAILISVAVDYFYAPNGTIREFHGNLIGVQDNWIVANAGTSSKPECYKVAEFDAPEGYTVDPSQSISSTNFTKDQYCVADDENALVQNLFVGFVNSKTAEEQAEALIGYGVYTQPDDLQGVQHGTIAGYECCWIYGTSADTDTDGNDLGTATAHLILYIDSVGGNSVVASLGSASMAAEELPDSDTMIAQANDLLKGLRVVQK